MLATDQKPIEVFNTLIGINNNRIESFTFAGKQADAITFRILFSRLVETSRFCKEALTTEVYKLGGVPNSATMGTSEFFRCWLQMHSALMNKNVKELIGACTNAEGAVLDAYTNLVEENAQVLNTFQRNMLDDQINLLKADAQRVSNFCGVFTRAA